mmetsp:Transcript_12481/g.20319  ORF Transcript_12481/g.20319 Transcript_12481/m.20319 type:complete len:82 (-) Transcript_12481:409-654(-)
MAPSGTVTASKMVDLDVVTLGLVVSFVVSNGDIPNWSGAFPPLSSSPSSFPSSSSPSFPSSPGSSSSSPSSSPRPLDPTND